MNFRFYTNAISQASRRVASGIFILGLVLIGFGGYLVVIGQLQLGAGLFVFANLLHEFSNAGIKHPLTEEGVEQARTLALALSGLPIGQVYASPILRAVQTTQILSAALAVAYEVELFCTWA